MTAAAPPRRTSRGAAGPGHPPGDAGPSSCRQCGRRNGGCRGEEANSVPRYRMPPGPGSRTAGDGTTARSGKPRRGTPSIHDRTPRSARQLNRSLVAAGRLLVGPFATVPNAVTLVRTVLAVLIGATAVVPADLGLLAVAYAVFWVGDIADGWSGPPARSGDACRRRVRHRVRPGVHRRYSASAWSRRVPVGAAGRHRLRPVVHGARHDAVAGVPVLAGAQPQLLPPRRPAGVAAQLVAAAKAANSAGVVGALALGAYAVALAMALAVMAVKIWSATGSSGCSPRRDGEPAGAGARGRGGRRVRVAAVGQRRGLRADGGGAHQPGGRGGAGGGAGRRPDHRQAGAVRGGTTRVRAVVRAVLAASRGPGRALGGPGPRLADPSAYGVADGAGRGHGRPAAAGRGQPRGRCGRTAQVGVRGLVPGAAARFAVLALPCCRCPGKEVRPGPDWARETCTWLGLFPAPSAQNTG